MPFVTSNGKSIYYEYVKGKTDTNIFLISGHKSGVSFSENAQKIKRMALDKGYGFAGFDPMGYGKSEGEALAWQLEEWLQNAMDVLKTTDSDNNIIIGHSMGGYLMLALSMLVPDKVKGLVGFGAGVGQTFIEARKGKYYIADFEQNVRFNVHLNSDPFYGFIDEELNVNVPVFLFTSLADDRVDYRSSLSILRNVKSQNSQMVLVKDASHVDIREQDLEQVFSFLKNNIGKR